MFMSKKINNKWRIIYYVDSWVEKNVASETAKELNQVELMKQFIGNWKVGMAKDTVLYWDAKAFGTGFESYFKTVAKDKIISEGKQLFGYDSKLDKCVSASFFKGMDMEIWALWFTSNNKFVITYYSDISNPDKSSFKMDGEFTSPNAYSETYFMNGKAVMKYNYVRVK